jgi:SLT domain-containing protein
MSDILNPIHNAIAAIRYIKSRYGSVFNTPLFRGGPYKGYATGGLVPSTRMAWVGERGPELLQLPGGSRVYNHRQSVAMAGGESSGKSGGYNQTVNIYSPEPLSPSETARKVKQTSRRLAMEWGF